MCQAFLNAPGKQHWINKQDLMKFAFQQKQADDKRINREYVILQMVKSAKKKTGVVGKESLESGTFYFKWSIGKAC